MPCANAGQDFTSLQIIAPFGADVRVLAIARKIATVLREARLEL
jgi:hypothetical protein